MTQAAWSTTRTPDHAEDHAPAIDGAACTPEAFAALYRRHFPAIAGYLLRRTGNQALAEDLAADTFLAAWKALPKYRSTEVPFRSWLLRIATNRANAVARRERIRLRVLGRLPARRIDPEPDAADRLYPALARLKPEHQSVVALVHLEGLTVEHAARVLGLPEGTVKSRLHRARAALKHELAHQGGDR